MTVALCLICLFYLTCFKRRFFDFFYTSSFLVSVVCWYKTLYQNIWWLLSAEVIAPSFLFSTYFPVNLVSFIILFKHFYCVYSNLTPFCHILYVHCVLTTICLQLPFYLMFLQCLFLLFHQDCFCFVLPTWHYCIVFILCYILSVCFIHFILSILMYAILPYSVFGFRCVRKIAKSDC